MRKARTFSFLTVTDSTTDLCGTPLDLSVVVVGRNLDNLNLDMWSRPRAASAPRSWAPVVARMDLDPSALVSDSADYAEERVRLSLIHI